MIALVLMIACTGDKLPDPPDSETDATESTDTEPADDTTAETDTTSTDDTAPIDDTATETGGEERVSFGAVQACDAPLAGPVYVESAAAMGLSPGPVFPETAAVADFDGDGDLDIALTYGDDRSEPLAIYYRDGEGFVEVGVSAEEASSLGMADLDGDGDLDLAVGGEVPWIARNDGDGFTEVLSVSMKEDEELREFVPTDIDGDGDVDLAALVSSEETPLNFLMLNEGDFSFTTTSAFPSGHAGRQAFDGVVFDWDGDHQPDLYVVNDMGNVSGPNALYRNTGGGYEDASGDCACDLTMSGMGGSVGDYDGDGALDLYLAATGRNVLLRRLEDGTYVDVTASAGADPLAGMFDMAWGTAMLDIDSDGDLDLAVAQGDFNSDRDEVGPMPFSLLLQEDGVFEDATADYGMSGASFWRAVVPSDHNGDGVLDLLVTDAASRPKLYLSQGCTAAGWLAVSAPEDSLVRVTVGERTWTQWVRTDQGFGGARSAEAWFGLGEAQSVDRLEVVLPWTGEAIVVEDGFEARRRVEVR